MTYHRSNTGWGRVGRGVGGALGAAVTVDPTTQIKSATQPQGAPAGVDPIKFLRAQVNRFSQAAGGPGPVVGIDMMPIVSTIDGDLVARTAQILGDRAASAIAPTESSFESVALDATILLAGDDGTYLMQRLPQITDSVRLYAESRGMPPAVGIPFALTNNTLLLLGALAVVGLIIYSGGR